MSGAGWIFGPEVVTPAMQRVRVTVGTGYSVDFSLPIASSLVGEQFAASNEERDILMRHPHPVDPTEVNLLVDDIPVPFAWVAHGESWLAQGNWGNWFVEVAGTRIDPATVKLRSRA
jgi:hypothetical protein